MMEDQNHQSHEQRRRRLHRELCGLLLESIEARSAKEVETIRTRMYAAYERLFPAAEEESSGSDSAV